MCGLTGFWRPEGLGEEAEKLAEKMAVSLTHRGPDGSGVWVDRAAGVALAHRRLAIVDLSPAGHQPMLSHSGRYVLVFNGEIYNHLNLRRELEQADGLQGWKGHSDSETLLACFETWGIERTLQAVAGMFAIVLWDRKTRTLTLARDRLGEKPLYYGWQGDTLLFGSELKALTKHPAFRRELDRNAAAALLRFNYIPAPHSIWRGIHKLPPGNWVQFRNSQQEREKLVSFWSLRDVAEAGQKNLMQGGEEEVSRELERLLLHTVGEQMVADVPLGALLSGGIDSSTIVALMQAQSSRPVRTFSIGFHEAEFDESAHATRVARHLGTEHTELFMNAQDVLDAVPRMPLMYDEPFADSSQLPTSMVMALARREVTVAMSGDGGDEVFGGYNRYLMGPRLWKGLRWAPPVVRQVLAKMMVGVSPELWEVLVWPLAKLTNQVHIGNKLQKLGQRMSDVRSFDDLFLSFVVESRQFNSVLRDVTPSLSLLDERDSWPKLKELSHRMMALDSMTYLPDDILVKVDRAAMATSLETRAPFLDHRVVEFAWQLPLQMKIAQGRGKSILRKILYRHVPQELIERPKHGFGVPLDRWLRLELREWVESLLFGSSVSQYEFFDIVELRKLWNLHLTGKCSYGSFLWSVLMLQAWLAEQGSVS